MTEASDTMRIGELSRRTGTTTHLLRAWETRYGLLSPERSTGGYRLYGASDERRVRAVLRLRNQGVSAADACERVLAADRRAVTAAGWGQPGRAESGASWPVGGTAEVVDTSGLVDDLLAATEGFDEVAAHATLDRIGATLSLEATVGSVLMPFLREVGVRWERGDLSIGQEHFASQLIRRRLSVHTLTWGTGTGPIAVLACPPGERHDIGLLCFGVLLGRAGWRVRYLGPDTPLPAIAHAAKLVEADLIVIASTLPGTLEAGAGALRRLSARHQVQLAGRGATREFADRIGAMLMTGDPVSAVRAIVAGSPGRSASAGHE